MQFSDTTLRVMLICVAVIVGCVTLELTLIAIIRDGSALTTAVSTLTGLVNDTLLVSGPIIGHMVGARVASNKGSGTAPSGPTPPSASS